MAMLSDLLAMLQPALALHDAAADDQVLLVLTDLASLDNDQVRLVFTDLAFLRFHSVIGLGVARSPLSSRLALPVLAALGL